MAFRVEAAFEQFRQNIEPPAYDREAATKRKNHLVSLLEDGFTILDSFPTGSLPRYTAVKDHADLDIFVVLHYGEHFKDKKPSEVLEAVRSYLADKKQAVFIRRNGQAVTLYYQTWPRVDVVPACMVKDSNGQIVGYWICDMHSETLIDTNPSKHDREMSERNQLCGERFKRIVKMIKWWNHQHSSLMQSFHIEVLALNILTGSLNEYSWPVRNYFTDAAKLTKSGLYHNNIRVDEYLDSGDKRDEVVKRLEKAGSIASAAWVAAFLGDSDHQKAISLWRQIFGDKFPSYG